MSATRDAPGNVAKIVILVAALVAMLAAPLPGVAERPTDDGGGNTLDWSPLRPGHERGTSPGVYEIAGADRPNPAAFPAAPGEPVQRQAGTMSLLESAGEIPGAVVEESLAAQALAVEMPAPTSIDMKVLVVHTGWEDFEINGITDALRRLGMPYDQLDARTQDLTAEMLFDPDGFGHYYAVILTTGNLYYCSTATDCAYGFTQDEWDLLWAYEAAFDVRQITSFTAPVGFPDTYGLTYVGEMGTDAVPLEVSLTPAGRDVFSYLTGAPMPVQYAWVYLATVDDPAVTTPLITAGDYAIASVHSYDDGRENLTVTVAKNDWALHSLLLWGGMIDWVTRGVYLGERHVNFDAQIDDLLIEDDIWDVEGDSDQTGITYRITGADLDAVRAWQASLDSDHPLFADVVLEMAFNGEGASGIYSPDTLTPSVIRDRDFSWVNHSYSHLNMDAPTTYAEATNEIRDNHREARRTLKLNRNYLMSSFVQPDISGLENPEFLHAAADNQVEYLISDTSRPEWTNPSPNAGIILPDEPRLLVIPRRPTALFYNLTTPAEWTDEYNHYYGEDGVWCSLFGCWGYDMTYAQIIDYESSVLLSHLLKWDIDPLMFHQANLRNYADGRSLLGDLLDATFAKYATYYTLPVRGLTQEEIGDAMKVRMAFDAASVSAEIVTCTSITLSAPVDVKVPVTGAYLNPSKSETYGGDSISMVDLTAGIPVTVPITCGP